MFESHRLQERETNLTENKMTEVEGQTLKEASYLYSANETETDYFKAHSMEV